LGFLASLRGWYFGKGSEYRALGDIWPLPKAAILGKVLHIELWGLQAPPGGCYLGKVVDIGLLGLLASIMGKVVDIVGLLGFLASIMGKVVDIAGLLGFLALPLCLPTSRWDLKSERPYLLKTSYAKAHFTLGVRAQKTWGQI
jgi:hypothetical protein